MFSCFVSKICEEICCIIPFKFKLLEEFLMEISDKLSEFRDVPTRLHDQCLLIQLFKETLFN